MKPDGLPGWPRGLKADLAAAYVGLAEPTMQRLRREGNFPAPVPLTRGRIVWLREALDNWLDDRAGNVAGDGLAWPEA